MPLAGLPPTPLDLSGGFLPDRHAPSASRRMRNCLAWTDDIQADSTVDSFDGPAFAHFVCEPAGRKRRAELPGGSIFLSCRCTRPLLEQPPQPERES